MNNRKMLTIQEYELPISIAKGERSFIAECKVWPDCYAQADTLEDVISEVIYVATSLIELYKEEGLQITLKLKTKSQKSESNIDSAPCCQVLSINKKHITKARYLWASSRK